jgi:DNA-directed RNA polymerase sigma subunit (sigma70/sigma32)
MSDHGPETLFNAHLQLAARIGQSFPIQGLSMEESTHEARIALWQAANAFDSTRGTGGANFFL